MTELNVEEFQYGDDGMVINGEPHPEVTEVVNLTTNPNMDALGGTVTIDENLITNPNMEAVAGTVELSRNLAIYGSAEVAGANWAGTSVVTRVTTRASGGAYSYHLSAGGTYYNGPVVPANSQVTVSYDIWIPSSETQNNVTARVGSTWGTAVHSEAITARDQWVRVTATGMSDDTGGTVALYPAYLANGEVWVDNIQIVVGADTEYFDGDTLDDETFTYSWTETPHASASIKVANNVDEWYTGPGIMDYRDLTTAGGPWIALVCVLVGGPDYCTVSPTDAYPIGPNVPIHAEVEGFNLVGDAPRMVVQFLDAAGATISTTTSTSNIVTPLSDNIFRMEYNGTTPSGTALCRMFVYGDNVAIGRLVRYRRALIVSQTNYVSGFFYGDTEPTTTYTYDWSGTPHASTSRRRATLVATWNENHLLASAGNGVMRFNTAYTSNQAMPTGTTITGLLQVTNPFDTNIDVEYVIRPTRLGGAFAPYVPTVVTLLPGQTEVIRNVTTLTGDQDGYRHFIEAPPGTIVERALSVVDEYHDGLFDGYTPPVGVGNYIRYEWLGTPHASQSRRIPSPEVTSFIDLKKIAGLDSAPQRTQQHDHEGVDGGYVDSEFESIRPVALEGTIYADVFNMESYLDDLKENFAPTRVNKPLYFQTDAGKRMVFAKSLGIRYDKDQLRRIGSADCQIQFLCEDPRIYSPNLIVASTTLTVGVTTGRGYPKSYPFGYGGAVTQNGLQLNLGGNRTTPGVLRIHGPVVNPRIINDDTGAIMEFQITLAEGTYLEIDLSNKSVRLNGSVNRRNALTLTGGWFLFKKGTNNLRFLGTQSPPTPAAVLEASAYSAWR